MPNWYIGLLKFRLLKGRGQSVARGGWTLIIIDRNRGAFLVLACLARHPGVKTLNRAGYQIL